MERTKRSPSKAKITSHSNTQTLHTSRFTFHTSHVRCGGDHAEPEQGTRLTNAKLSAALAERIPHDLSTLQSIEFSKAEWEHFRVGDVWADYYIQSSGLYFRAAAMDPEAVAEAVKTAQQLAEEVAQVL